jgi:hypothetical protein
MRGLRAEARAARIPAEMMQFVITAGKIHLPNQAAIFGGSRIKVDNAHGVALSIVPNVE